MFVGDDDYGLLFGLLEVWKQLPGLLIEIVALACVGCCGIPWTVAITIAVAGPVSLFKFALINRSCMRVSAFYATTLKWPARIVALLLLASHAPANAWYFAFVFLGGAKIALLPWDALFNRLLACSLSGQLPEYRALQAIGERCLRLPISEMALAALPLELETGESFERLSKALVEAAAIEHTDPQRYSGIVAAATKILGREPTDGMIRGMQAKE